MENVTIYTDGACHGNPGPGGYAAVLLFGEKRKEVSGGFRDTTNNRMEILAAINGLEALAAPCKVTLYTDSQYLVNSMTLGWVEKWQANNWKRNKKERAKNVDLWKQLLHLCEKHQVAFKWTRGHVGTPENERCDQLANKAAQLPDLPEDIVKDDANQSSLF